MLLLAIAGGMALVLSAVGIYGVISYTVNQRRAEIGVRMALGAHASQVGRMVVGQSLRVAAVGIAIGLAGALATTRVLQSLLFGVSPTDPLTLVGVTVLLTTLGALASYMPGAQGDEGRSGRGAAEGVRDCTEERGGERRDLLGCHRSRHSPSVRDSERRNAERSERADYAENNVCHPERQRGIFSNVLMAGPATMTSQKIPRCASLRSG